MTRSTGKRRSRNRYKAIKELKFFAEPSINVHNQVPSPADNLNLSLLTANHRTIEWSGHPIPVQSLNDDFHEEICTIPNSLMPHIPSSPSECELDIHFPPLIITNQSVLSAICHTTGTHALTKAQYRVVRLLLDATHRNIVGIWSRESDPHPESFSSLKSQRRMVLPAYVTIWRKLRPAVLKYLTPKVCM